MSKKKNANYKKGNAGNNKKPATPPEKQKGPQEPKDNPESKSAKDDAAKQEYDEAKDKAKNDPAWYQNMGAQLYQDVARVYASEQFGRDLDGMHPIVDTIHDPMYAFTTRSKDGQKLTSVNLEIHSNGIQYGGIATYKYIPSIGYTKNRNHPANIAAQMLYTNMRSKVSGSRKYQPSDVFIHIAAIADIYTYIAICKKLYASAFSFSQINLYIGKSIMESLHVDSDDMVNNLGNFRAWLNSIIKELNSYLVPASIPYYALKVQTAGSLYLENGYGNFKDQLYQAIPLAFYKFTTDERGKGMLEYDVAPWARSQGRVTVAQLKTFGEALLASIRNDSDTNDINGDLARSFPAFVSLETLGDEAYITPVYDPMMLEKYRNAEPMMYRDPTDFYMQLSDPDYKGLTDQKRHGFYVYQNANGELVSLPIAKTDDLLLKRDTSVANKHLLNVDAPEITPDLVMEATRYMYNVRDITLSSTRTHQAYVEPDGTQVPADLDGTALKLKVLECGSEVVVGIDFYNSPNGQFGGSLGEVSKWRRFIPRMKFPTDALNGLAVFAANNSMLQQNFFSNDVINALSFKYIPWIASFLIDQTAQDIAKGYDFKLITQLENYTFIGSDQMQMLHKVALMSLLCPPGVVQSVTGN